MKALMSTILIILITSFSLIAQNESKIDLVKKSIDNLFDLSKNNKFEQIADLIAYSGKDSKRNLVDSYNYKDSKEASKVKRIAKKIKAFLDISDKYSFGKFNSEQSDNQKNYSIEVLFISGSQELKTLFTFIESGNKILMADLN